jgi:leader peptidase (prepilin peptidase)/N-methyltransferase
LAFSCIWVAYVDLIRFRIPDLANLSIFLVGAAAIGWTAPQLFLSHLIAAAIAFAFAWLAGELLYRRLQKDALGMGDAKLIGAATMWVGIAGLPSLLLVAALTGIAYALLTKRQRKRVPFGPFLALGLLVVWFYGPIRI